MHILNKQWTVAKHPVNSLGMEHFALVESDIIKPVSGEILLRTHYLNLAPVMRMYMMKGGGGESTESSLKIGDVIHGRGVAEVIGSKHPDFKVGDFVHGQMGWQTYKTTPVTKQEKFIKMQPRDLPVYYGLSALGMTGYSAYCGFVTRGEPQPGDSVLVSGASGGVGSLVIQIAKAMGCNPVTGIAGSEEKCSLIKSLGADAMINYKKDDLSDSLKQFLPSGIDIYFDNVGGETLDTSLENLASNARVVLCGSISEYARTEPFGPVNYTNLRKHNADMRGFFVYNHKDEYEETERKMAAWIKEEKVHPLVDIMEGFENMPNALIGLYTGKNRGKQIVKVIAGEHTIF